MSVLLHALLFATALGALHLWLARRGRPDIVTFCVAGAVTHVVLGLLVAAPALVGQAGRSLAAWAWIPLLAVGLFATGAVLSLLWLGAVRGLERWVASRRAGRRRP